MKLQPQDIYNSVLRMAQPLTIEELYRTVIEEAEQVTGATHGTIFFYQKGEFERVYSTTPEAVQTKPRKNGFTYQAFTEKRAMIVRPTPTHLERFKTAGLNSKQMVFVPLIHEDFAFGVLCLHLEQEKTLTNQSAEVLEAFAALVSIRLRNISLMNQLKTALETRDLFISMASHELKTPLTTVSAYAQLIERNIQTGKEIKPEWAGTLRTAIYRMTKMINELLQVNRIRSGTIVYSFQAQNVAEVLDQAQKDFAFAYPDRALNYQDRRETQASLIWGDYDKLVQVVTNLLNNAAKFSEPGQKISLILETKGKKVLISVCDQGQGIAEADLDHIFEEFYRAQGNTQQGLGLGLYISKKIIEAHKGKIEIQSVVNQGTTVVISLPTVV